MRNALQLREHSSSIRLWQSVRHHGRVDHRAQDVHGPLQPFASARRQRQSSRLPPPTATYLGNGRSSPPKADLAPVGDDSNRVPALDPSLDHAQLQECSVCFCRRGCSTSSCRPRTPSPAVARESREIRPLDDSH
eukprot:scaffold1764_cov236-Pinguiococcus_pyrenoidosus.AAC.7